MSKQNIDPKILEMLEAVKVMSLFVKGAEKWGDAATLCLDTLVLQERNIAELRADAQSTHTHQWVSAHKPEHYRCVCGAVMQPETKTLGES